jgi:hypothetical protein
MSDEAKKSEFDDVPETQASCNHMSWPTYEGGALDETDQTFREMAGRYPFIEPLRELRYSLSKLRLNDLHVGNDGRTRSRSCAVVYKRGIRTTVVLGIAHNNFNFLHCGSGPENARIASVERNPDHLARPASANALRHDEARHSLDRRRVVRGTRPVSIGKFTRWCR